VVELIIAQVHSASGGACPLGMKAIQHGLVNVVAEHTLAAEGLVQAWRKTTKGEFACGVRVVAMGQYAWMDVYDAVVKRVGNRDLAEVPSKDHERTACFMYEPIEGSRGN